MLRVLVIDDHEAIRRHVGAWVAQTGVAEVGAVCASAAEALSLLSVDDAAIDVVLCDVHMDEMDGGEFAFEVQQRGCVQRVVLFSAHRLDEHRGLPVLRKMATTAQLADALCGENQPDDPEPLGFRGEAEPA